MYKREHNSKAARAEEVYGKANSYWPLLVLTKTTQ